MCQRIVRLLCVVTLLLFAAPVSAQDCSNPEDVLGALIFNHTYGVFQGCTDDGWQTFHHPACPDGDECAIDPCTDNPSAGTTCTDGTIYVGDSPDGDVPMYTTPADAATRFTWNDGGTNYQNTAMTNCTDATPGSAASCRTGADNTTFLINASGEPDHPFAAAAYCANLAPPSAEAFGHADWYLPAQDELNVLFTNKNAGALGGTFDETGDYPDSYYWSSSENSSTFARGQEFENGAQFNGNKPGDLNVRCVRKGGSAVPPPANCTLDGQTVNHGASYTFYSAEVSGNCAGNSQSRTCTDGTLDGSASFQYASCSAPPASCTLDGETVAHGASYTFYSTEEDADCAGNSQSRTCTDGTLDGSASFQYASCSAPPAACTGTDIGGNCWFYGASGASCNATCAAQGLTYDSAVTASANSGAQCPPVMNALGAPGTFATDTAPCPGGFGCFFYAGPNMRGYCSSPATTGGAAYMDIRRACACEVPAAGSCTLDGQTVNNGDSATFYSAEVSGNCAGNSQSRTCTDGTLDGDANFQYSSCSATCTGSGIASGGHCWYPGYPEFSCDYACGAEGLSYSSATENYAGSGGSASQCNSVLSATGAPGFSITDSSQCSQGVGCYLNFDTFQRGYCATPTTTSGATGTDAFRMCACQQ